jgi:hypothetical protein
MLHIHDKGKDQRRNKNKKTYKQSARVDKRTKMLQSPFPENISRERIRKKEVYGSRTTYVVDEHKQEDKTAHAALGLTFCRQRKELFCSSE